MTIKLGMLGVAILALGCSDSGGSSDGSAGAGAGGSGGGGTSTQTATISGTITEFAADPAAAPIPIEGVEVCLDGSGDCVTTAANGTYSLTTELTDGQEGMLTLVKAGYLDVLLPNTAETSAGSAVTVDAVMGSDALVGAFAMILMTPYPAPDVGVSAIIASTDTGPDTPNTPLPGVTYEVVSGGGTPYFVSDQTIPETPGSETGMLGWGGFFAIPPGEVEVKFGGTATNCVVGGGWEGSAPDRIRMPVRGGFQTQTTILCQP